MAAHFGPKDAHRLGLPVPRELFKEHGKIVSATGKWVLGERSELTVLFKDGFVWQWTDGDLQVCTASNSVYLVDDREDTTDDRHE